MSPTLLIVTYELRVPIETFLERVPQAARSIAEAPGLVWKIWGLERSSGSGTSAYLFHDHASAEAFADGPAIAALRDGPASSVEVRIATVERSLSALTHAEAAIGASGGAAAA